MKTFSWLSMLLPVVFAGSLACQYHGTESDCPQGGKLCSDGECHDCCNSDDCGAGEACCDDSQCHQCCTDDVCDDEIYCNGVETCTDFTCTAGDPVDCDDGVPCSTDVCVNATFTCSHKPDHSLCPQDTFCDIYRDCVFNPCFDDSQCWPDGHCCPDGFCYECCGYRDCSLVEICVDNECVPDPYVGCHDSSDCDPGLICCNDGECHDCCIDDDCLSAVPTCRQDYIICNYDYECECVCCRESEDCSRDPLACCHGLVCDIMNNTCMPACVSDGGCTSRTEIPFHQDLKCNGGVCDFDHCSQDTDCPSGKVCFNADCVTTSDCAGLGECVILPPAAITQNGTTVQLAASAYLLSGILAPGKTFTWSSGNSGMAAVDGAGLVTGGSATGNTVITAVVDGCANISCTASVINFGQAPNTRVLVVDELDSTPIAGATVVVGAETPVTTDANGVAQFAVAVNAGNPADVTVSKQEYNYVTLKGVQRDNLIVHLSRVHHLDYSTDPPMEVAGGIKGDFDFSTIRCEAPLRTCDVTLGIGGLSVPGNPANLNIETLLGGWIVTEIELGGSSEEILLPIGLTLCLNMTCFKQFYTPTGVPGKRVAWGIGGKADLADLIDKLGPIISGGSADIAQLVVDLIPMIQNFNTDLVPNVNVVAIDMLEDLLDIDGDGDITDYVPDYDNFPRMDMTPKVKIDQPMTFNAPILEVGTYDTVILIGGIIVRGAGFVPLGVGVGADSTDPEDVPDGMIDDPIVLEVAAVAGRIPEDQIRRVVLALALNMDANPGDPDYHAGRILLVDDFSGVYSLPLFMLPPQLDYNPAARRLDVSAVPPTADMFQALFSEDNRAGWHFFSGDSTSFSLPAAPPEGDRSARAGLIAMDLRAGASYQDIPAFNGTNLDSLAELVEAFVYVGDGQTTDCGNCSTGETGGFLALWLALGLALLRRRLR